MTSQRAGASAAAAVTAHRGARLGGVMCAMLCALLSALGAAPAAVLVAYVAAVSVPLVCADVSTRRLPNALVLPGLALTVWVLLCGAVRAVAGDPFAVQLPPAIAGVDAGAVAGMNAGVNAGVDAGAGAVAGALAGALAYVGICAVGWWFGGVGFGDVKLAGILGAAAGAVSVDALSLSVVVAISSAAAYAGMCLAVSSVVSRAVARRPGNVPHVRIPFGPAVRIPFGPAMIGGYWAALIVLRMAGA